MKQKDIAIIIGAAIVAVIVSAIISSKFLAPPSNRQQAVQVVPPISPSFNTQEVSSDINSSSINPTQLIVIGNNSNQAPFNQPKNNP